MAKQKIYSPTGSAPLFVSKGSGSGNLSNRKLVVVQLSGGNDGLNTIVPYQNDVYYNQRPTLGIKKNKLIDIDGNHGFNQSMKEIAGLFDQGLVSVVNRVGYPNASRSHFKSMDFWKGGGEFETGWLGRYLDTHPTQSTLPAIEISDVLTQALRGEFAKGVAFDDLKELHFDISNPLVTEAIAQGQANQIKDNENLQYIYNVLIDGKKTIDPAYDKCKNLPPLADFPDVSLGAQLKSVAEMIVSGLDTQIYYVTHGSFDTHVTQSNPHNRLLSALSQSVGAFVKALRKNNKFEDVCILIFTEFGRRVKENGSRGTDHGAGNSMYVISSQLNSPGFHNPYDTLAHLVAGDLAFEIDFRQIYATILEDWLAADSTKVLNNRFEKLNLFSGAAMLS